MTDAEVLRAVQTRILNCLKGRDRIYICIAIAGVTGDILQQIRLKEMISKGINRMPTFERFIFASTGVALNESDANAMRIQWLDNVIAGLPA